MSRLDRRLMAGVTLLSVAVAGPALAAAGDPLHPGGRTPTYVGLATPTSPTGHYRNGTVLPNGRLVTPAGRTSDLGDFPTSIALSPDGATAIIANTGQGSGGVEQGNESLQVVDVGSGRVIQTVTDHEKGKPPFFNSGIAFSPDGNHLFATGGGNDAVYVYAMTHQRLHLLHSFVSTLRHGTPTVGLGTPAEGVPATAPEAGDVVGYSRGVAITPDGRTLLVTNEQGGSVAALDAATGRIAWETQLGGNQEHAGTYPAGVAVSPDGRTAYVAGQGFGVLYGVDVKTGALTSETPVGDHAVDVAVARSDRWAAVAAANDDTISLVDLTGTGPRVVARVSTHTLPAEALGSSPTSVTIDDARGRIYVTNAGDDDVAVLGSDPSDQASAVAPSRVRLFGHIPTAFWPAAVRVARGGALLVASAKGFGGVPVTDRKQYDGNDMVGTLNVVPRLTAARLRSMTAASIRDLTWGRRSDALRPAGSPIPDEAHPGQSPIKHVVLVVRENRTFDQVFGDLRALGRRDADVQPSFLEFGLHDRQGRTITPNAHAIAARFGTSDNFYSDGEASIQGHFWTANGTSTDYGERSWLHYYSDRNHTYDPVGPAAAPRCGSVFSHLGRENRSFRNFGELEGTLNSQQTLPVTEPHDGCEVTGGAFDPIVAASTSPSYPDNLTLTSVPDTDRVTDFEKEYAPLVAADRVPSLSYVLLGNDHTDGTAPGKKTPQAHVATNDLALGQLVDYLSHTAQWSSTAVFVEEDDSQDGLDHRDGHRNVLLVASPWSRPGTLSHLHISQVSVLRTIELILGLPHLSAYSQFAPVPWDLFATKPDLRPYAAIDPTYPLAATNGAAQAGTPAAVPIDISTIDVAGPVLEAQLWQATHPGVPLPALLLAELRQRGGVTDAALAAWSRGRAYDGPLLRAGLRVAPGAVDRDG